MKPLTDKQKFLVERLGAVLIVVGAGFAHIALAIVLAGILLVLAANFSNPPEDEDDTNDQ